MKIKLFRRLFKITSKQNVSSRNKVKNEKKIDYQNQYIKPLEVSLKECNDELEKIFNEENTLWAIDALQEKYFDINAVAAIFNNVIFKFLIVFEVYSIGR